LLPISEDRLTKKQARFPSNSFSRRTQFFRRDFESAALVLADTKEMADLSKAMSTVTGQAKAKIENASLSGTQIIHQVVQGLLPFTVGALNARVVIRHCFGEFEVAVIIENSVQRHRSTGLRFGDGSNVLGCFLCVKRVPEGLADVYRREPGLRFLVEVTPILGGDAARGSRGDFDEPQRFARFGESTKLHRLQSSSMRHIKPIDRLHQTTDGFL
jgi:hypothetical protein